ncbi:acyl-CoA carboxylase epsilon subunit [Streptomyces cellulosae]|uniref:Acyl-CoA carboxylase epsilon subunit n=1 Tax=Streptomyces cellulosae TaxID=1968 RepID=A0ABW7YIG7_STRCE
MTGPAHPPSDGTARTRSVRRGDSLPEIRVLRGRPAPAELAAALIVIRTLAASRFAAPATGDSPGEDGDGTAGRRGGRPSALREPFAQPRGPGAWRRSGWL